MTRPSALLSMLLGLLSAHGLAAEALDSWRAWVVFKQFVRVADETPEPGVSVQVHLQETTGDVSLFLLRQVVEPDGEWLRPVGGVVCELTYSNPPASAAEFAAWSFDSGSFARFVDHVEQHAGFADLIARRPDRTDVYWEDADL